MFRLGEHSVVDAVNKWLCGVPLILVGQKEFRTGVSEPKTKLVAKYILFYCIAPQYVSISYTYTA